MKHKSIDYKISAVKYYINYNVSMNDVCEIFDCKKTSLKRWIDRYSKDGTITRYNRKPISYKITKQQVDYAIKLLKNNEQITMEELAKQVKNKYNNFSITPRQLNNVIREQEIKNAISKVKKENYENYFTYAYKKDEYRKYKNKKYTRRKKLKNYKIS